MIPSVQAIFDAQERALRAADEAACRSGWHPEAWEKNLVGGSGLTGGEMFEQGSRKKWFPKADLAQAAVLGDGAALVVPCGIFGWEQGRVGDRVAFLLVKDGETWRILGGGERRAEVDALAARWLKKEPLAPSAV